MNTPTAKTLEFSAPGKVILLGEWAVLANEPAVATAVSAKFTLRGSKIPNCTHFALSSPDAPLLLLQNFEQKVNGFYAWAWTCLKQVLHNEKSFKEHVGWNFHFQREWPLSEGLGSSSALYLTLKAWAAAQMNIGPLSASDLPQLREELKTLQGARGSGLDVCTQLMGGTVLLQANVVSKLDLPKAPQLLLIHTGKKMDTLAALKKVHPSTAWQQATGQSVKKFLQQQDWERAINEHYLLLCELGVVPDFVQAFRNELIEQNLASALKTCGAGGGDTLLIWTKRTHNPLALQALLQKHGYWQNSYLWNAPGLNMA